MQGMGTDGYPRSVVPLACLHAAVQYLANGDDEPLVEVMLEHEVQLVDIAGWRMRLLRKGKPRIRRTRTPGARPPGSPAPTP